MRSNRKRVLAEALSVDAWHDPFRVDAFTSAVYVELTFHEGRLGGDDDSFPFTFKINLKKALLTVRAEQPLEIERGTVARSIPEAQVELTQLRVARDEAQAQVGTSAELSPTKLAAALRAQASQSSSISRQDELKVVQSLPETMVTPRPGGAGQYSWELEPTYRSSLRGQPWDPSAAPRLRVRHRGALRPVEPSIHVEVRCALEDVHISDLQPKKVGIAQALKDTAFNRINEAAAIQHLKIVLREADLEPSELDNRFSDVVLANILSVPAR